MKRALLFLVAKLCLVALLVSCGPSAEEKAAYEKARQDSVYATEHPKESTSQTVIHNNTGSVISTTFPIGVIYTVEHDGHKYVICGITGGNDFQLVEK